MDRDSRDIVVEFIEQAWNNCRLELVPELLHPDYAIDGARVGPNWVAENVLAYHSAFQDLRISILHCVQAGTEVATLARMQGTHQAEWKGIPATGQSVDCKEAAFWRVADNKIIAASFVAESLTLRVQLGQIPADVWQGTLLIG